MVCPLVLNSLVIPVESPTVQKALTSSKANRARPKCPSVTLSKKMPKRMELAENRKALIARFNNSTGMVEWNSSTRLRPRIVAIAFTKTKVKVEVLIPPAVDPEEPPMNMKTIRIRSVGKATAPKSTVLNPAVRVVTDWKKAVNIRWP